MRRTRVPTLLLAAALLPSAACTGQTESTPPISDADLPQPVRESEAFEDQTDLLHAIREGTFTRRAGIQEEIAEATEPPVPAVVRIDFEVGTDVPEDQTAKIHELARALAGREAMRVDVVGCSDPSGSEALNRRISQARAESVAWALEQFELPPRQIGTVEGRGERCEVRERAVFLEPREVERTG